MASIPVWMLGKHLTAVTIYPQTIGTAGALTDASTKALTAVIDSLSLSISPNLENINAVNVNRANNVVIEDDVSLNLSIIEVNNTGDPSVLGTVVLSNDVFRCVFTKGTATGSQATWQTYASRGNYQEGVQGKGKQIATLELHVVDTGSTSYVTKTLA